MTKRSNYVSDQIDRTNAARQRYDSNSSDSNRQKVEKESARTDRAIKHQEKTGAGRGSVHPPMSRKWRE